MPWQRSAEGVQPGLALRQAVWKIQLMPPAPPGLGTDMESPTPSSNPQAPSLLRAMRQSLLYPSLLTVACAFLIHPWADEPRSRAISLELHDGNVFAYMTLIGLAWVILTLGSRFWRGELFFSAVTCGLGVALLIVIPLTEPRSSVHNFAFAGLVVLMMGLFLIWALDTFDMKQVMPPLVPLAIGTPFYGELGIGGLQLLTIGSLLIALNLTSRHLETRGDR